MPKHPTRGLMHALSTLLKRARTCWMSVLALYLTKPVDEFAMLTTADQQALATVLRRFPCGPTSSVHRFSRSCGR